MRYFNLEFYFHDLEYLIRSAKRIIPPLLILLPFLISCHRSIAYGTQYTLEGQLVDKNHAKGLIATNAVASLAATHSLARDFTEALWNTPLPSEFNERYYDGLLYLMGMLHCSGEFRIWRPE